MKKLLSILMLVLLASCAGADTIQITLEWTAPGDDGMIGTAAAYDFRYGINDSLTIADASGFYACTQIANPPAPDTAGTEQDFSFSLSGMTPGDELYFAVKTVDAAGNWSGISNIARATVPADTIPPGDIDDITVTVIVRISK